MTEKKKTTKHVVDNVLDLVKIWQKKSYNGITYPLVDGIIFSNTGSKGRTPLFDASLNRTEDIFAYWRDEEKGILEISAPEPGYEIKAPKSMANYFRRTIFHFNGAKNKYIPYLDVTHLDVSKSTDFSGCFKNFGCTKGSKIKGLESWDVGQGKNFSWMFEKAFSDNEEINLDLSSWQFSQVNSISMNGMFREFAVDTENVTLNLNKWNVATVGNFSQMFCRFALEAKTVNIIGIEGWTVTQGAFLVGMFGGFAPISNCRLDLSNWSKEQKLSAYHEYFSLETFFKIKEPEWAN